MTDPGTRPGPRERHLLRKQRQPQLFAGFRPDPAALVQARLDDQLHTEAFIERLRGLVAEAAGLKPNAESEQILDLKARLDRAYTEAAALGGDQRPRTDAIRRLVEAIMRAVWSGVGNDARARTELEEEEQARLHHYALLEHALVADLMLPDSPVSGTELVPTLLSESAEAVEAALWLFEGEQRSEMAAEARALLTDLARRGVTLPEASARLAQIEGRET